VTRGPNLGTPRSPFLRAVSRKNAVLIFGVCSCVLGSTRTVSHSPNPVFSRTVLRSASSVSSCARWNASDGPA